MRGAFQDELGVVRELAGEAQAIERLGGSGDILCGDVGFLGVGGEEGGSMGDGGVVTAGLGLGRVGGRSRERTAEGVDDLIVAGAGEVEGDFGGDGGGVRVRLGK